MKAQIQAAHAVSACDFVRAGSRCLRTVALALPLGLAAPDTDAQQLAGSVLGGAGGVVSDATYQVVGTLGEPISGHTLNTTRVHDAGFWYATAATTGDVLALSASTSSIEAVGGDIQLSVTAGAFTQYSLSSDATWATVASPSNDPVAGSSEVDLAIEPNLSLDARMATISIGGETHTVTQQGMSAALEVAYTGNTAIGTGTGAGTIRLLALVPWTVRAPSWIDLVLPGESTSTAVGNGSLVSLSATPSASSLTGQPGIVDLEWSVANGAPLVSRVGTIEIVDDSGNVLQSITVTQDGVGGVAPVNVSTRTQVGSGDKILIPGFVVGGTGKSRVLVRGVGPTLTDLAGLSDVLPDPEIRLFRSLSGGGSELVGQNDSWTDDEASLQSLFSELGAFDLSSELDSAAAFELDPGAYTVQLRDRDGQTGLGIVEIYVIDASAQRGLVNISARAEVGPGDRVMIPGFVVGGNQSVQVIVRGVGPGLAGFGVNGVLEDPLLEVYNADQELIASNDDWGGALSSDFAAVGAFPLEAASKDAAVLLTVSPGSYTAHIKGKGDATGVALLEVYFIIAF